MSAMKIPLRSINISSKPLLRRLIAVLQSPATLCSGFQCKVTNSPMRRYQKGQDLMSIHIQLSGLNQITSVSFPLHLVDHAEFTKLRSFVEGAIAKSYEPNPTPTPPQPQD